jgi:ubiquitin carboxyl-terminal hydrolase 4/11/15
VHLTRFSSIKILCHKIDTFVDFPVEGLDLGPICVERQVAEKFIAGGVKYRGSQGMENNSESPLSFLHWDFEV